MPAASFGPNVAGATFADAFASDPIPEEQAADPFDRLSGARSGSQRPIQLPSLIPGEETEDCRMVRFVGRSWMPMASDYRPLCIMNAGNEGKKSGVEHIDMADLRAGMRIIVREGGEKDVIKAIAQDTCGDEHYDRLWRRASLWREALKSGGFDPGRVAKRLQSSGVRRHIATIRSWLTNPSLIGPRSDDDVIAISQAFPLEGKSLADWKGCCDAISELRGLHLSAGMRLTDHLVGRCGRMLLEPTETETAVEFKLGTVWVLEVAEVEASSRPIPIGMVNRLQWLSSAWHTRMYDERVKDMAA
jgi:hypothetical protein